MILILLQMHCIYSAEEDVTGLRRCTSIRMDLSFITNGWTADDTNGQERHQKSGHLHDRNSDGSWKVFQLNNPKLSSILLAVRIFDCAKHRNYFGRILRPPRVSVTQKNTVFRGYIIVLCIVYRLKLFGLDSDHLFHHG